MKCAIITIVRLQGSELNFLLNKPYKSLVESEEQYASMQGFTTRGVPRTGFRNDASTLKQYFVLPKNRSKYYLKYRFLAFSVLGILGLGTPLVTPHKRHPLG